MHSSHQPSAEQLAVFKHAPAQRPVVLFYQLSAGDQQQAEQCTAALATLAAGHGGALRWAGSEEQVLIGPVQQHQRACSLHFQSRAGALDLVQSAEHQRALASASRVLVSVCSEQPRAIRLLSALLARLLPRLPMDRRVETSEEPFLGTSTMPTQAALQEFRAHPQQEAPLTMINWLKFREHAAYDTGAAAISGRSAYLRYGKVAMRTTHALGAKLLFAARYQQLLIGHDGNPAPGLWHECALMQYPGRRTFDYMSSLHRYRQALVHRQAGLAEQGQALTVAKPDARFVWPSARDRR